MGPRTLPGERNLQLYLSAFTFLHGARSVDPIKLHTFSQALYPARITLLALVLTRTLDLPLSSFSRFLCVFGDDGTTRQCPFISELDIASSRSFGQKRTMSMRMRDDKQSSTAAAVTNTAKGLSLDTPAETEASRAAPKAKSTRPLGISLDAPTAQ